MAKKSAAYTHFLTWTYIERPWLGKRHTEGLGKE